MPYFDTRVIKQYNDKGQLIHFKDLDLDYEEEMDYDDNGNKIYYKNSIGDMWVKDYDEYNRLIYSRDNNKEEWYMYDEYNRIIEYRNSNGFCYTNTYKNDIHTYSDSNGKYRIKKYRNGRLIYYEDSNNFSKFYKYNDKGQLIEFENIYGYKANIEYNENEIRHSDTDGYNVILKYNEDATLKLDIL